MRKVCFVLIVLIVLIPSVVLSSDTPIDALPKEILALVQQEKELDGFTLLTADEDTLRGVPKDISLLVLSKGECCILYVARETADGWIKVNYSRKGLYPTREKNENVRIAKVDSQRFEISWPGETYRFYAGGTDHYCWFYEAEIQIDKGMCIAKGEGIESVLFTCNGEETRWFPPYYDNQTWLNYNPYLFPKSIEEADRSNRIMTSLSEYFPDGTAIKTKHLKRKTHLYNCPDKNSKEIDTSLLFEQDTFIYYGCLDDEWYIVGCQNGLDYSCVGYITIKMLSLSKREQRITKIVLYNTPLIAEENTWLTMDPFCSQNQYIEISAGTKMIGLGGLDANYAYVEIELNGETIRGFVPKKHLDKEYIPWVFCVWRQG